MRLVHVSITLAAVLGSSPALAENWVTVFDDDPIWASIDKDSIRRGSDGLVYFQSDGPDKADRAADCQRRLTYTLKLYVMQGLDYPNWRNDGSAVVTGSAGEAELQYACANAG
jgi:hypothetical protein